MFVLQINRPPFDSSGAIVRNLAFMCPVCLKLWAVVQQSSHRESVITPHSCEACNLVSPYSMIPGSLVPYFDLDLLHYLPADLLFREYLLTFPTQEPDPWLLKEARLRATTPVTTGPRAPMPSPTASSSSPSPTATSSSLPI